MDIAPFPFDRLATSLGLATALDVLRSFSTLTAELSSELKTAVSGHDTKQTAVVLRELNNSCRVLGAIRMQRLALSAEQHLHKADWDGLLVESTDIAQEAQSISRFASELLS